MSEECESADGVDALAKHLAEFQRQGRRSQALVQYLCNVVGTHMSGRVADLSCCFHLFPNPFHDLLLLLEHCLEHMRKTGQNHNASVVNAHLLKPFKHWVERTNPPERERINLATRTRAFHVATTIHTQWFELVAALYKLEECKEICIGGLKALMGGKRHLEAVSCVFVLKIVHHFSLAELFVPFVVDNKYHLVFKFLEFNVPNLMKLVEMFDKSLIDSDQWGRSAWVNDAGGGPVFKVAHAEKFIKASLKQCGLDPFQSAPNYANVLMLRGTLYYVRERYQRGNIPGVCFSELVEDALLRYPSTRAATIEKIWKFGDAFEALRLCQVFRIPVECWPPPMRHYCAGNLAQPIMMDADYGQSGFLQLPDYVKISYVRGCNSLRRLLSIAKKMTVVSVDSEWTPLVGCEIKASASLMQVCAGNDIFLVELDALVRNCSQEEIVQQFQLLFCDPNILKIGFDFANDVQALTHAMPFCGSVFKNMRNTECIYHLAVSTIRKFYGGARQPPPPPYDFICQAKQRRGGLRYLCQLFLGVDLDKRQRLSLWTRRPLRNEQVTYAALDVYSVMAIYRQLTSFQGHNAT